MADKSRRDLLKYFGIGAVIAPAVGGPLATLIEVPKIEIAKPEMVSLPFNVGDVKAVFVTLHLYDGSTRTVQTHNINGRGQFVTGDKIELSIRNLLNASPAVYSGSLFGDGRIGGAVRCGYCNTLGVQGEKNCSNCGAAL